MAPKGRPPSALADFGAVNPHGSKSWRAQVRWNNVQHNCPNRPTFEWADADRERLTAAPGGRAGLDEVYKQIMDEYRKDKAAKSAADAAAEAERVANELAEAREFYRKAQLLDCKGMADSIADYWTSENRPQDMPHGSPGLRQCVAQFAALAYVGASRPSETLYMKHDRLNQSTYTVTLLRHKPGAIKKKRIQGEDILVRGCSRAEQTDFKQVWQLMFFDRAVLFSGEALPGVFKEREGRRWRDATRVPLHVIKSRTYYDMLGRPVNIKASTFRRSRSVHLLGRGFSTLEDLRFMLAHKDIETTRKYVAGTGRDLSNFAGELRVEDGVFARLRRRLEEYYSGWKLEEVERLAANVESARTSDAVTQGAAQAILGEVPPFMWKHFGLRGQGDDTQDTIGKVSHALNFMRKFWGSMRSAPEDNPALAMQTTPIKAPSIPSSTTAEKAVRLKRVAGNAPSPRRRVRNKMCVAAPL